MEALIIYRVDTGEYVRTVEPAPGNILGPVSFYTHAGEGGFRTTIAEIDEAGVDILLTRHLGR